MDDEQREQIKRLRERIGETVKHIEDFKIARWKQLAGEHVDMLESPDVALSYLYHPSSRVRHGAMSIMAERWPSDPRTAEICEKLISNDPDEVVRSIATGCLGNCYLASSDKRVSRLLSSIVKNDANSNDMRILAYIALMNVQGRDLLTHSPPLGDARTFPVPEGIDWSFVKAFD